MTRRHSNSGGFLAVVGWLLILGVIVEYFWWFVGALAGGAALIGLFFGGRALLREVARRRELAEEREFALRRQADRQHRWLLSGDSRGLYGAEGASVMRAVIPEPSAEDDETQENTAVATLATTDREMTRLITDKPVAWPVALFGSVLVQRMNPLLPRIRDSALGFTPSSRRTRVSSGARLAQILVELLDELSSTVGQVQSFMSAPAFMESFGDPTDNSTADPGALTHTANRLMDYHDRFLELSERCRGLSAPCEYSDLLADCARLLDMPLQTYRTFIAEYVEVVESLPQVFEHATGPIHLGNIVMELECDDRLFKRIFKRLKEVSRE
ncbi:MAG: hypothetical protein AB7G47_07240 [Mycolicibacterium sp.]|uniref:hypothetical protein n=1 Tax=Mycolicibacterium sp. TaxID=2320850 RepID=UPI003D0E6621